MTENTQSTPLQNATLCQVGLVVRNADRIARKLSAITGVKTPEPILTDTFEKARTQFRGSPSSARAKLIIFNMGQVAIEIIEPIGAPSTWSEFLETHGEGVHHIAFSVKSANDAADGLFAHGIPPIQSGVFEGGSYIYSDAEKELGVILELLDVTTA